MLGVGGASYCELMGGPLGPLCLVGLLGPRYYDRREYMASLSEPSWKTDRSSLPCMGFTTQVLPRHPRIKSVGCVGGDSYTSVRGPFPQG